MGELREKGKGKKGKTCTSIPQKEHMKVVEKRGGGGGGGGGGAKAGGGLGWGVSLEVSTLARIIESNTRRVRYDAGGHAEEDSIIQGCEPRGVFLK